MISFVGLLVILALCSWLWAGLWLGEALLPRRRGPLHQAHALSAWLQEWQLSFAQGRPLNQLSAIPQFKFFGVLASRALGHARTYGSFPREILWEWREGLNKEIQFEQKWLGIKHGSWAQFALFSLITWLFIALTGQTLEQPLSRPLLFAVVALQVAGFFCYWPLLKLHASRQMQGHALLMESLYTLRSLGGAGMSSQQVLTHAQLDLVVQIKNPKLSLLRDRVAETARLYQQQGLPLTKETQLLIQEVWFIREAMLLKLVKTADHFRLAVLLVFFGSAYFLFLLGLIQQLLTRS